MEWTAKQARWYVGQVELSNGKFWRKYEVHVQGSSFAAAAPRAIRSAIEQQRKLVPHRTRIVGARIRLEVVTAPRKPATPA